MANYSIPNSTPAIGRISTQPSARSKKSNSNGGASSREPAIGVAELVLSLSKEAPPSTTSRPFDSMSVILCWALGACRWTAPKTFGVGRSAREYFRSWTFFFSRRVKGAWWPSRSSKPSSVGNGRGRFDSYPLRPFSQNAAVAAPLCRGANARRQSAVATTAPNLNRQTSDIEERG